jgi:hypothetical protein
MPVLLDLNMKGRGPRAVQGKVTKARKATWEYTGVYFHGKMRDNRFTEEHAREANYTKRRGENIARGTKEFKASYTGRKLRIHGHTRPLEFSGDTRRRVRAATVKAFALKCQVRYQGASKFNFRNPRSQINMGDEFRRILPREAKELGQEFNNRFDQEFWRLKDEG